MLTPIQLLFLKCFIDNNFNVSKACKEVGMDRKTFYNWVNDNDLFAERLDNIKEVLGDLLEDAVRRAGLGMVTIETKETTAATDDEGNTVTKVTTTKEHPPNVAAAKFMLMGRFGDRGYTKEEGQKTVLVQIKKEQPAKKEIKKDVKKP